MCQLFKEKTPFCDSLRSEVAEIFEPPAADAEEPTLVLVKTGLETTACASQNFFSSFQNGPA